MELRKENLILFIYGILIFLPFISSVADFTISNVGLANPSEKVYQGDTVTLVARISSASDNSCDIKCTYSINTAPYSSGGVGGGVSIPPEKYKDFNFEVETQGLGGTTSYVLSVTCNRVVSLLCWSGHSSQDYSSSINFLYAGDGVCTTEKEKCADYGSYTADPACNVCQSLYPKKECRPDSQREVDNYGCATYCGNGVAEKDFETCSNCPTDVGECDGISCLSGNECEGKYCVHEKCWNKPYKEGDGFCDLNNRENCKNSVQDCACGENERCDSTAICETYCGNGICEPSETTTCKLDCKWCGDGECSNKEGCKTCSQDCGVCESKELNQEISNKTKEIIEDSLKTSTQRQRVIIYSAMGLILLVVIGYLIFKFILNKKEKSKITKTVDKSIIEPVGKEIKALDKNIIEPFKEGLKISKKKNSSRKPSKQRSGKKKK